MSRARRYVFKSTLPTTPYPHHALRRMVSWVAKQVGYPVSRLRQVEFGTSRTTGSCGRAWLFERRVRVVIDPSMAGWSNLVETLAHEIEHLSLYREQGFQRTARSKRTELSPVITGRSVLKSFLQHRHVLVASWLLPPNTRSLRSAASSTTLVERRAAQAQKMLTTWERKLRMAERKVAEYGKKVRYYERRKSA